MVSLPAVFSVSWSLAQVAGAEAVVWVAVSEAGAQATAATVRAPSASSIEGRTMKNLQSEATTPELYVSAVTGKDAVSPHGHELTKNRVSPPAQARARTP